MKEFSGISVKRVQAGIYNCRSSVGHVRTWRCCNPRRRSFNPSLKRRTSRLPRACRCAARTSRRTRQARLQGANKFKRYCMKASHCQPVRVLDFCVQMPFMVRTSYVRYSMYESGTVYNIIPVDRSHFSSFCMLKQSLLFCLVVRTPTCIAMYGTFAQADSHAVVLKTNA